jgi:sarcosine oxidase
VTAQLEQAQAHGATVCVEQPVDRWQAESGAVRGVTARGAYRAGHLVISAGAWVAQLLPDLALPFRIERQVQHWFAPKGQIEAFTPQRLPIHLWQFDGERFFYGFPDLGAGLKMAFHHRGEIGAVDAVRRDVDAAEVEDVRRAVRRFVPDGDGALRASSVCLYTNTPDEHFWIDRHPAHANVIVASPCSGHGFKFAPVVGEIVADLIGDQTPRFDLGAFRWRAAR